MAENILIVGGGGREHALGYKLGEGDGKLFFAPGNGGTQEIGTNIPISPENISALLSLAQENQISLTVVGPEASLAWGIVDAFEKEGLPIFGPTQLASRLESSKAYAEKFMDRHRIPHPQSYTFKDPEHALQFIAKPPWSDLVIKANGLCAGKGVVLPESKQEAETAIRRMMQQDEFGEAGHTVVIQERLFGREVSVMAFSDGKTVIPLLPAQDHKRMFDQDKGPNTGGVGAYAPVPFVTPEMMATIKQTILEPTIDGMNREGKPYKGILYAGLMLTKDGPKVLEYNVRFGDPETQPLISLLESDLRPILLACINGTLAQQEIKFRQGAAVCVVLASEGYPANPTKGEIICGLAKIHDPDLHIFHAGTIIKDGHLVTNGGRVLGVTAYGPTIPMAIEKAYAAIGENAVNFTGMHYRTDIAHQALLK